MSLEDFDARIAALKEEIASLDKKWDRAQRELRWYMDGRTLLYGKEEPDQDERRSVAMGEGALFSAGDGPKPTLRRAILGIMESDARAGWSNSAVISALKRQGWMPGGENAEHSVRGMLALLARKGELKRLGRGVYALPGERRKDS